MRIVLIGAPGSGKGTQSENIIKQFSVTHLATGDLLRAEVAKKSPLGLKAEAIMKEGKLVPDEIVLGMIEERIKPLSTGFLLDGFPRNVEQAKSLDQLLSSIGQEIDKVIYLDVPFDLIKERLLGRGRQDDNEETINKRLDVFQKETAPVIEYYEKQNKCFSISGVGEIDAITKRIFKIIEA